MAGTRSLGLIALVAAALLAGCGDGDTTTVVNETTTTVVGDTSSTTTDSSSTTSTTSGDDGSVLSLEAFQSPSGNIACVMTPKFARCDISERNWEPAAAPGDCQLDYGQGIELTASGSASFVCAGDTVLNPDAETLPYGSSSQVGSITCDSEESGVECENVSGGSFSLSREDYDLN